MFPVPAAGRGNQEVVHGLVLVHLPKGLLLPHREDGLHRVEAALQKRVQPRRHDEDHRVSAVPVHTAGEHPALPPIPGSLRLRS